MSDLVNLQMDLVGPIILVLAGVVALGVISLVVGRISGGGTRTKDIYADHRKILERQIELITDPRDDPGGLALRSNRDNVELLSLSAKDGDLYRRSYISVYDDEIEAVADYLSVEACERKQETGGLHDE